MDSADRLLKTRQVATALGFSVSTIKRWVDGGVLPATRTDGGHRLIRLGDALRYARGKGLPSRKLEALAGGSGEVLAAGGIDDGTREALLSALEGGEALRSKAILHAAHASVRE